jgi:hypothetical protein
METLTDASKEVGLKINVEKCMSPSCQQNAGQNRDIKIAKGLFENLSQFKYLVTTVTLRGDCTVVTLATTQSRIFCLLVCCPKT